MHSSDPFSEESDRAVSEMTAVGTLIGVALLLVVGIGLNVFLLAPAEGGAPEADFTFRYVEQTSALIVTHDSGDSVRAGDIYIEGTDNSASWAALAGSNESSMVEQGDIVQVAEGGAYGQAVGSSDRIAVVWRNESVNETSVLSRWNGASGV